MFTHCSQIHIRKKISRSGFLHVSRYSVVHSIDLRRVFLRYINISICKFGDSVSCLGLYGGLYGQNLPYKFKKSYSDFLNCNFEKSYRTTGPRSDLKPDSWSWANSGLDSTFGNVETGIFWVTTRGAYGCKQTDSTRARARTAVYTSLSDCDAHRPCVRAADR